MEYAGGDASAVVAVHTVQSRRVSPGNVAVSITASHNSDLGCADVASKQCWWGLSVLGGDVYAAHCNFRYCLGTRCRRTLGFRSRMVNSFLRGDVVIGAAMGGLDFDGDCVPT